MNVFVNDIKISGDELGLDGIHASELHFRQRRPFLWAFTLFGPIAISLLALLGLLFYTGWGFTSRLIATTGLSVWLFGRFMILAGDEGTLHQFDGAMTSLQLFLLITYLDLMMALVLSFHIGLLFRLPVIGPRAAALVTDGQFILHAHPWMQRMTLLGLVAFVGFPLAATGSVGGSIFGRLLGMSRVMTFCGIAVGSVMGNGMMYWFSDTLGQWVDKDHSMVKYGGLVVILAIVFFLERRYQTLRRKFASQSGSKTELKKVVNAT